MTMIGEAVSMSDEPTKFFNYSQTDMFSISRDKLEKLQLEALKCRFDSLRENVSMLKKMADGNNIDAIERLEDVIPVLFKHTIYKSYPASLLSKNKFEKLTKWLGKLTTYDLSNVDVSHCDGIDSWCAELDKQTPLRVAHSSGTTGTVSFLPIDEDDYRRMASYWPLVFFQEFGDQTAYDGSVMNVDLVRFDYRTSYRSGGRLADYTCELIAGSEDKFHAMYPERMSSDLLYLAGKIRAAQAAGSMDNLEVSPALLDRKDEFGERQKMESEMRDKFFDRLEGELKGKRAILNGYSGTIYQMMLSYKESGKSMSGLFGPGSILQTGGGGKTLVLPDGWEQEIKEFTGVEKVVGTYAMSEVMATHPQCEHGHYHILPSVIPFVLDPESGESLPRTGRVTGRAAFFDLGAKTRWGGFISGDEITVEWDDTCACGRQGAHVVGDVERYGADKGGDDKINCAGTPQAQEEALNFLMDLDV